jgi:hypothetical protein
MPIRAVPFLDLHSVTEDKRIEMIGHRAVEHGETVGFLVDVVNGDHAKGDRYIEKLKRQFPSITVLYRGDGPVDDVETIKVGVLQ